MLNLEIDLFILFLWVLSLRFFIFDFYLFRNIRNRLKKVNNYYINKLLKCCYCQGFWSGFISFLILIDFDFIYGFIFGFSTAILSYYIKALTYKACNYMEIKIS